MGLIFPNLEHRHHLIEQADRARRSDLTWYGLPPDVPTNRSLGGMAGFVSFDNKRSAVHASSTTLLHTRGKPATEELHVTVQRRGGHHGASPLARLALPLVRDRDGDADSRWAAHSVEDFRLAQERALTDVTRQAIDVRIDDVLHAGEAVIVGVRWAAFIPLPAEDFDIEIAARGWPMEALALVSVTDLDPYIAGAREAVGPLLAVRGPQLLKRQLRLRACAGRFAGSKPGPTED